LDSDDDSDGNERPFVATEADRIIARARSRSQCEGLQEEEPEILKETISQ
jgi:hypothetical protein